MSTRAQLVLVVWCFVFAGLFSPPWIEGALTSDYDEYSYGDENIDYDSAAFYTVDQPYSDGLHSVTSLPLCCQREQVYDHLKCVVPPLLFPWQPKVSGAPINTPLEHQGFPRCSGGKHPVSLYQKEVDFTQDAEALLPIHVQQHPAPKHTYCIAKVYDPSESSPCEDFQTLVFACLDTQPEKPGVLWTGVGVAHTLILLTLITYFCMSELRANQGQYLICLLLSLLIYNLCLYPGSYLFLNINYVSCIALGAVKYFFFCGVFLWFLVICFDIWRTLRSRQDISGRRRFLLYSAISWVAGAVLTTVVLVLPYVNGGGKGGSRMDPIMEDMAEDGVCKLREEVSMILQISQTLSLLLDFVLLVLATFNTCSYTKFGNGLQRCDAMLCLKQGWKLFAIMVAHTVSGISLDTAKLPISSWQYILVESIAIFSVFAYRRTVLTWLYRLVCRSKCSNSLENGSDQEKGQLTQS